MVVPESNKPEKASTYIVQNRNSKQELTRLTIQDTMITEAMGGVLPEQNDVTGIHDVLDIACGTGGWLIEVARTYPHIQQLKGIDISQRMIDYATDRAKAAQVGDRIQFHVMDALQRLDFPDDAFDLINQRFSVSFIRRWEWSKTLMEMQRVARPQGIIRVTEICDAQSNSSALTQVNLLFGEAFERAGHLVTPEKPGSTESLSYFFKQYGMQQVQISRYTIEYEMETPYGQMYREDMTHMCQTVYPFLKKWGKGHENFDALSQQAIADMHQPDFHGSWTLMTIWGYTPANK